MVDATRILKSFAPFISSPQDRCGSSRVLKALELVSPECEFREGIGISLRGKIVPTYAYS